MSAQDARRFLNSMCLSDYLIDNYAYFPIRVIVYGRISPQLRCLTVSSPSPGPHPSPAPTTSRLRCLRRPMHGVPRSRQAVQTRVGGRRDNAVRAAHTTWYAFSVFEPIGTLASCLWRLAPCALRAIVVCTSVCSQVPVGPAGRSVRRSCRTSRISRRDPACFTTRSGKGWKKVITGRLSPSPSG